MRFFKAVILILVIVVGVAALSARAWHRRQNSPDRLLLQAQQAFAAEKYDECLGFTDRALRTAPESTPVLILAGQAATKLRDLNSALNYFGRVSLDGTDEAVEARVAAGELAYELGRARESEKHLRAALESSPDHGLANGMLAYLLVLEGRSWEALPYLLNPVRKGEYPLEHLLLLGSNEPLIDNEEHLKRFKKTTPNDQVLSIRDARIDLLSNRFGAAAATLRQVVKQDRTLIEAQARLGEALAKSNSEQFVQWNAGLPEAANLHPQTWVARGLWAEKNDRPEVAMRCFWEALKLDPEHRVANHHLGTQLMTLHEEPLARPFLKRAADLELLGRVVDNIRTAPQDADPAEKLREMSIAAELTERLGRIWEAWGWSDQAIRIQPDCSWALAANNRLRPKMDRRVPRTVDAQKPKLSEKFANVALPAWSVKSETKPNSTTPRHEVAHIRFQDDTAALGVDFTFDNGGDPRDQDVRLVETTGGGVGVLDMDGDLWPDLYWTQGGAWPPNDKAQKKQDKLFRNSGKGKMQDVTALAYLGDTDYSQGVAVGDFDNDGFADIYLANIGESRLYRNNGDGTFSETPGQLGPKYDKWTTSCLIADVNGDSIPDIYDVNYGANSSLERLVCRRGSMLGGCGPGAIPAAQDRLCLGKGNGEFEDVSQKAGILAPDGMGLGIVAADFDGTSRISLFIANDAFPNYFFQNDSGKPGETPRFEERGVLSGLAFDQNGLSQACMGVAAGDANDDGMLDLFVTNYYEEANTLYLQRSANTFEDATESAGLREPSLPMLGFGSQFLDAELDGRLDLVLVNGHVFDMSDSGIPYRMRPQFFRNSGQGKFQEVMPDTIGNFFSKPQLGRGLARLDWNRDGLEEFAISHLDTPAAILTNKTETKSHYLVIHLRGRQCDRDAIGTIVTARLASSSLVRQMTAGDGYEASNHRVLVFGIGGEESIQELTVQWPHGGKQTFVNVPVDRELMLIDGASEWVELPRE